MSSQFKVVGIIGKAQDAKVVDILKTLVAYLRSLKQAMVFDTETASYIGDSTLTAIPKHELGKHCQLLIVVGGDGSLLHAAHAVVQNEIPILGINRGRLGFLTDIHPDALEKIKAILQGKFVLEKRFLLDATVTLHGEVLGQDAALNEVALISDTVPHMIEFEIYINDRFLCSQDSDGLIIATPTGSTAYALSGGGPILHPELDAVVIVPMCPHTLSMRPIVISGNHQITIIITPRNKAIPRVTCDSKMLIQTPPHSRITISKKQQQLHLIHPTDYDYYESLRSKLYWGRKLEYTD
jgi:NAD+ kinase